MASSKALPLDSDGLCMLCKQKPVLEETLICRQCTAPWHLPCLPDAARPATMTDAHKWLCPDCDDLVVDVPPPPSFDPSSGIISNVRAIYADDSLTEAEKVLKRQGIVDGTARNAPATLPTQEQVNPPINIFDGKIDCAFCLQLPERPVTTPCGHNFCLDCFQKWIKKGKTTCTNCRRQIPAKMASNPRINDQLAIAIRLAKQVRAGAAKPVSQPKAYCSMKNESLPDTAFTTERAVRKGKANACSGKIFVTIPSDFFGPITAEYDPRNNRGVLVGDSWEDRMDCRQWGAHFPHVAGIAGQKGHGAQSVALSGGYIDDEDHGEWFLYTGSGGKDLSGNKRTNKQHSFDQKFENMNEALRVSCKEGYPVRVVRSHKEKRSSYAPQLGVRYDGVYRIEKCWRKKGIQGCLVCRYLFVRCDNEPAPWTSDECGDRPRPLPVVKELKGAIDITERKKTPAWDFDEEKGCWMWKRPQPESKKGESAKNFDGTEKIMPVRRIVKTLPVKDRLKREFGCQLCRNLLTVPVTTPCGHNFCKACLEGAFSGQTYIRQRASISGRTLRAQKNVLKCPSCPCDIAEFLQNIEVNREMKALIETLMREAEAEAEKDQSSEESNEEKDENDADADAEAEGSEDSMARDSGEKAIEEEVMEEDDKNRPKKRRKCAAKGAAAGKEKEDNALACN